MKMSNTTILIEKAPLGFNLAYQNWCKVATDPSMSEGMEEAWAKVLLAEANRDELLRQRDEEEQEKYFIC